MVRAEPCIFLLEVVSSLSLVTDGHLFTSNIYTLYSLLYLIVIDRPLSRSYKLPYYPSAIRWELSLVFLLPILDLCRIKLATRGNTTECVKSCFLSSFLAAPSILGYVFFLAMQTYVLHVDVWLNSISLAFVSAEMLFLLAAAVLFGRAYASYQFWL